MPNEQDNSAYLLPTDGEAYEYDGAIKINDLYAKLTKVATKQVTVVLDACFSGSIRDEGMLAQARGIRVKPKLQEIDGNMVVLTASSGEETAYPYKSKNHGLFTYFLLKKMQETAGNVSFDELATYVQTNVKQQSLVVNKKSQTPQIIFSVKNKDKWKSMGFK
jgi:hypothetical protein